MSRTSLRARRRNRRTFSVTASRSISSQERSCAGWAAVITGPGLLSRGEPSRGESGRERPVHAEVRQARKRDRAITGGLVEADRAMVFAADVQADEAESGAQRLLL